MGENMARESDSHVRAITCVSGQSAHACGASLHNRVGLVCTGVWGQSARVWGVSLYMCARSVCESCAYADFRILTIQKTEPASPHKRIASIDRVRQTGPRYERSSSTEPTDRRRRTY